MKNRITLFIMVLSGLVIFQSCTQNSDLNYPKLQQLSSWMTGSFSSKMQSEADTNFFNIHLHMVPIWQERTDAIWLYVEQAAAWSLDKPYRQRVYKLRRLDDNLFESSVFSITDPIRFAGDWKEQNPLAQLTPDSLTERTGCAITLKLEDSIYNRSTKGKGCLSSLRGADYATSEVRIENNRLTSWDRGFDSLDVQVWGAIEGPYVFDKLKAAE